MEPIMEPQGCIPNVGNSSAGSRSVSPAACRQNVRFPTLGASDSSQFADRATIQPQLQRKPAVQQRHLSPVASAVMPKVVLQANTSGSPRQSFTTTHALSPTVQRSWSPRGNVVSSTLQRSASPRGNVTPPTPQHCPSEPIVTSPFHTSSSPRLHSQCAATQAKTRSQGGQPLPASILTFQIPATVKRET